MKTRSFIELGPSFAVPHIWPAEGERVAQDRKAEHLSYMDKANALARRLLITAA